MMLNFLQMLDSLFQQELPEGVEESIKASGGTLEKVFVITARSGNKVTITEKDYREMVLNVSNPYVPVGAQRPELEVKTNDDSPEEIARLNRLAEQTHKENLEETESPLVKEFKEKHEALLKEREQNEFKMVVSLPKGATLEEGSIINKLARSEKWGSIVQFVSNSPTLSIFTTRRIVVKV